MADRIIPVALRLWLRFLCALLLLGYGVGLSILFGAIGGFAGGTVSAWWQAPGGIPAEPKPQPKATMPAAIGRLGSRFNTGDLRSRIPILRLFTRRDRRLNAPRRRSLRS